uniref:hypothetical protein n=1 Tax=Candidatus Cryptobacteroides bacterium TaxID=3085639 RepID=UPI004028C5B4
MKKLLYIILSMLIFGSVNAFAQEQEEQKVQTPEEMAAKEADRLGELLKLEYWQVFYVDSTLQHDFTALQDEMNKLQSARVENYDLYMSVRDKWFEQIDNTYKKIFTPEQWALYLKTGAAKNTKAREKRKEKMQKSSATAQPAKKEKPMSF